MLAIVPPIIRGKLDESPLASTQSFQRSMQEMANSIDPGLGREDHSPGVGVAPGGAYRTGLRPAGRQVAGRKRAAVRRNRILASLTIFSAFWGAVALVSGKAWCLVVFAMACGILVLFWGLTLIVPNLAPRSRGVHRTRQVARPPHRQAS